MTESVDGPDCKNAANKVWNQIEKIDNRFSQNYTLTILMGEEGYPCHHRHE